MTEISDLASVTGGIHQNLGREVTYLLGSVAAGATAIYGATRWCSARNRRSTLIGEAVCSGFYVRQGVPSK